VSISEKRIAAVGLRTATEAQAVWELPAGPSAARQARIALSGWLASVGIDPADGPGFDVVLAASELAANAGVHGVPPILLDACLAGDGDGRAVSVGVSDASPHLSVPAAATALAEHGRGLGIVAAVALQWGSRETPEGKETWFQIAVPMSADSASSGRAAYHNDPFWMNGQLSPGATRREALAS
jgi:hypothetical protein